MYGSRSSECGNWKYELTFSVWNVSRFIVKRERCTSSVGGSAGPSSATRRSIVTPRCSEPASSRQLYPSIVSRSTHRRSASSIERALRTSRLRHQSGSDCSRSSRGSAAYESCVTTRPHSSRSSTAGSAVRASGASSCSRKVTTNACASCCTRTSTGAPSTTYAAHSAAALTSCRSEHASDAKTSRKRRSSADGAALALGAGAAPPAGAAATATGAAASTPRRNGGAMKSCWTMAFM